MVQVTERQNKYLLELSEGPKTTRDLMLSQGVSIHSAGKMILKLRNAGLVKSSKLRGAHGNIHQHKLVRNYQELVTEGMVIINSKRNAEVPYTEVLYVAILRNGYLTGQELVKQHLKIFPDRAPNEVSNIIEKAKAARLCR